MKSKSVDHYTIWILELHGVDFSKCPIKKINFNSPSLPQISGFMGKTFQTASSVWHISKIFYRSDIWSKISHMLVVQLETFFFINSLTRLRQSILGIRAHLSF
jgi:hypothetical protein